MELFNKQSQILPSKSTQIPSEQSASTQPGIFLTRKRSYTVSSYGETTNSDTESFNSDKSSGGYSRLDLPEAYLAVKNLLSVDGAEHVRSYLRSFQKKSHLASFIKQCGFFDYFTDREFDLLWDELKRFYGSFQAKSVPSSQSVAEFFKNRFKAIEEICLNEWSQNQKQTKMLYIPGRMKDFHEREEWAFQLNRYEPNSLSDSKVFDFIINRISAENWPQLCQAFVSQIRYCSINQVSHLIKICSEIGYFETVFLILQNTSMRSAEMLTDIDQSLRALPIQQYEPYIDFLTESFVSWIYKQSKPMLITKMRSTNTGALSAKILPLWVDFHLKSYIDSFNHHKTRLSVKENWYPHEPEYQQALTFYKSTLPLLEETLIWCLTERRHTHIVHKSMELLKAHPLLSQGPLAEGRAHERSLNLLIKMLQVSAPSAQVLEMMGAITLIDRNNPEHACNILWREWLGYWKINKLERESFKAQLIAVQGYLGDFVGVDNQLYKICDERKTFLDAFVETFAPYSEIFMGENSFFWTLEHMMHHSFSLNAISQEHEKVLPAQYSYSNLENFLKIVIYCYEGADQTRREKIAHWVLIQDITNDYSALTNLYEILAHWGMEKGSMSKMTLYKELLDYYARTECLSSLSSITIKRFCMSYKDYLFQKHAATEEAEAIYQQFYTQLAHANHYNPFLMTAQNETPSKQSPVLDNIRPISPLAPIQIITYSDSDKGPSKFKTVRLYRIPLLQDNRNDLSRSPSDI